MKTHKYEVVAIFKKIFSKLFVYIIGNILLRIHYDKKYIIGGRHYRQGRFGMITSSIWKLIYDDYVACKKMKINLNIPWPVSPRIGIICPENISFHPDDLNDFQGFGNYYQAIGKITIGRGTYIAPNVGIITANHTISDLNIHDEANPVTLGEKCWIGMNSVILPGVTLGPNTVVGAGSIVTHSFPKGYCIIAGNPAKIIREIVRA